MDSGDNDDKTLANRLKKLASIGIGTAFMTEEAIRNLRQELPLPKDIVNGLLKQAKAQKDELIQSTKSELKNYLQNLDLSKELDEILEKYEIRVDAKLSFRRKKPTKP